MTVSEEMGGPRLPSHGSHGLPGENPLGKRVMVATGSDPIAFEVVGVVGDARIYGVGQPAPMTMYATAHINPVQALRGA